MILCKLRTDDYWTSALSCAMHFGLEDHAQPVTLEITWPNGTRQRLTQVAVDRLHTVVAQP